MRVLSAYEDSHRSYGEALVHALGGLRPDATVSLVRAGSPPRWDGSTRTWWSRAAPTPWTRGAGPRG